MSNEGMDNWYTSISDKERFLSKISKSDSGCWEWIASKGLSGYGQFRLKSRMVRPHRLSYIWLVGPIPEDLVIDHICRNRGCCNPEHLRAVTFKINAVENSASPAAVNKAKLFL